MIVVGILEKQGYAVQGVASGEEALALLRRGVVFDLVLLDIGMPGLDGFATFREFDAYRCVRPFSVAFLTGRKDKDAVSEAIPLHPDDYIVKPIDPSLLNRKVRGLLQRQFQGRFLPRTAVSFVANLTGTPLKYTFRILEISELDVLLETMVELAIGSLVTFRSPELAVRLGHDAEFAVRIRKCESEGSGFYAAQGSFEGLSDAAVHKMRLSLY
jgi:DNA-binding response OmpR family regulator